MRFKEFLQENEKPDWFLYNKEELIKLLNPTGYCESDIDEHTGTISTNGSVTILQENLLLINGKYYLPTDFQYVQQWMEVDGEDGDIGSLRGLPETMSGSLYLDAKSINFDFLPKIIGRVANGLVLGDESHHLTSLKGIGKTKAQVNSVRLGKNISSDILGLLLLQYNDGRERKINPRTSGVSTELFRVCRILDTHLNGEVDIMDAQEELIQAGLKEYAKL